MNNDVDRISLEVNEIKNECEVFLYLDDSALEILITDLQRLKSKGDHAHYMSDQWGGTSLTTAVLRQENRPVHHFKITKI